MVRPRKFVITIGAAAVVAILRHGLGHGGGRSVPGGILIRDAVAYDMFSRRLLRSLYPPIAADVAAVLTERAAVLEVGCGPGHLSLLLARDHGLDVTGLDLDPAMIERARGNADRAGWVGLPPSFRVGDVASLPYPDRSFDLVITTLSMHHWTDPTAGLAEIGRVLRPDGRALIWDIRPGALPFHGHLPDLRRHTRDISLDVVSVSSWSWPWRLNLIQRIELVPQDE